MSTSTDSHPEPIDHAHRRRWEAPRVRFVGRVRDLVQGGGKSGTTSDSDPQSTTKTGGG